MESSLLEPLPNELIYLIFNCLLLSTIRNFGKTCKFLHKIAEELIITFEKKYFVDDFSKINTYSVEKFTFELCHDNFYDMIPEHYIIETNTMIIICPSYFNNISFLEKLKKNGKFNILLEEYVCKSAAKNGQIDVLEWAFKNNYTYSVLISNIAIEYNKLELLKWLHKNGFEIDRSLCFSACPYGHLDILIWGRENGFVWNKQTYDFSVSYGHLNILIYARKNGFEWIPETCVNMAMAGHLDCLRYLHENGCEWNSDTCTGATFMGNLNCLQYAHENGCNWNSETCSNAAQGGYLDCLQYSHENGCEWDYRTCLYAANNGQLDCLKYAHENGCRFYPEPEPTLSAVEKMNYIIDNIAKYDDEFNSLIEQEKVLLNGNKNRLNLDESRTLRNKLLCYSYISEKNEYIINCMSKTVKQAMT